MASNAGSLEELSTFRNSNPQGICSKHLYNGVLVLSIPLLTGFLFQGSLALCD